MKKIVLHALLVLAVFLSCCKKDAQKTLEEKLLGKWNYVKYEHISEDDFPDNDEIDIPDPSNHPYIVFKPIGAANNLQISENSNDQGESASWTITDESTFATDVFDGSLSSQVLIFSDNNTKLIIQFEKTVLGIKNIKRFTLTRPYVEPAP